MSTHVATTSAKDLKSPERPILTPEYGNTAEATRTRKNDLWQYESSPLKELETERNLKPRLLLDNPHFVEE